jgi:hypothetical protein
MLPIGKGFVAGLKALLKLLLLLLYLFKSIPDFLSNFWRALREHRWPRDKRGCCVDVPASVYRRPDPLLYSQSFLMKQGIGVTWDNPDIQLFDKTTAVSSAAIEANKEYNVVVRIWNNSYDAPAVGLGVSLSFLSFGIGQSSTFVDKTLVDLGVKGSGQCPAFATFKWKTPEAEGHYCLQATLQWPDDANPDNNVGQENTNVKKLQSPAVFTFPVANQAGIARQFELKPDTYHLRPARPCTTEDAYVPARGKQFSRLEESKHRWTTIRREQAYELFAVPDNWSVTIEPSRFELGPREEIMVTVSAEPRTAGFTGRQSININAFATDNHVNRELVGGVTLHVDAE